MDKKVYDTYCWFLKNPIYKFYNRDEWAFEMIDKYQFKPKYTIGERLKNGRGRKRDIHGTTKP